MDLLQGLGHEFFVSSTWFSWDIAESNVLLHCRSCRRNQKVGCLSFVSLSLLSCSLLWLFVDWLVFDIIIERKFWRVAGGRTTSIFDLFDHCASFLPAKFQCCELRADNMSSSGTRYPLQDKAHNDITRILHGLSVCKDMKWCFASRKQVPTQSPCHQSRTDNW